VGSVPVRGSRYDLWYSIIDLSTQMLPLMHLQLKDQRTLREPPLLLVPRAQLETCSTIVSCSDKNACIYFDVTILSCWDMYNIVMLGYVCMYIC
jgi:hypothetical protein